MSHYFAFKPHMGPGSRPCAECGLPYDFGDHTEITMLKPFTSYVCPVGTGNELGHSSMYTGAYLPEVRSLRDHFCICGAEFVEEDKERWLVAWEMPVGPDGDFRRVEALHSHHTALQHCAGLEALAAQGEPIRNITMAELVERQP